MSSQAAAANGYAVKTEDLVRTFGDTRAVDGIDLAVAEGEIFGFLGPNGAGKSTTMRVLCTLLKPTSGRALVVGYDVVDDAPEVRVRIGMAQQDAALDEKQTGREILNMQARLYGLTKADREGAIERAIELAQLGAAIDDRVGTYSGGMRRRLDLAASLIHGPELIFLDEPTTGLDPASRALVWEEVRRLNRELGMTVFLTTQYMEEADALAQRVAILAGGKIVTQGAPAELKRAVGDDVIVVDLAADDIEPAAGAVDDVAAVTGVTKGRQGITVATAHGAGAVAEVAVALANAHISPAALTVRTPSLDDVFLQATGYRMAVAEELAASPEGAEVSAA